MKTIFTFSVWLIFSSSLLANALNDDLVMFENCLGNICIGDNEKEVIEEIGTKVFSKIKMEPSVDGYSHAIRVMYAPGYFEVSIYEDRVVGITSYSEAIKSKDGIGPGTPLKSIFEKYTFKVFYFVEGKLYLKFHETTGYLFVLGEEDIPESFWVYVTMSGNVVMRTPVVKENQSPELYFDSTVLLPALYMYGSE